MSVNKETNGLSVKRPKRLRKGVYIDVETSNLLEAVKKISSYDETFDTVIVKRALEYVLHNKQDLKNPFDELATKTDIDKSIKKHLGKLTSGLEIFQSETFQNHQFVAQLLKQLSEITDIKELKETQKKYNGHFFNEFKTISALLKEVAEKQKPLV